MSMRARILKKNQVPVSQTSVHSKREFAIFIFIYFLHFKTDIAHRTATESILLTFSQVTKEHKLALQIITYIGCGLSLAGETLTIVAYALLLYAKCLNYFTTSIFPGIVFIVIRSRGRSILPKLYSWVTLV